MIDCNSSSIEELRQFADDRRCFGCDGNREEIEEMANIILHLCDEIAKLQSELKNCVVESNR